MISGPSVYAERERRARLADRLTEKDVARALAVSHHYVKSLCRRGLLRAEMERDHVWSYDPSDVDAIAEQLAQEETEGPLYMSVGEAARLFGLANYQFEKVFGQAVRSRTLLISQQRQYLRSDVDNCLGQRVG